MKNILLALGFWLLIVPPLCAQVKGSKNIVTDTYSIPGVEKIDVSIVADLTIVQSEDYYMTIETDDNLVDLVGRKISDGKLTLDQVEWISASVLKIKIGIPKLTSIFTGAHGTTKVDGFIQSMIEVNCEVGAVVLKGKVDSIRILNHVGEVDASEMIAQSGHIVVDSWGSVKAYVIGDVTTILDEDAGFMLVNKKHINEHPVKIDTTIKFINFKVKNNSWKKHSFYVRGPKADGSSFSYGFSLWPGQKKSERWTIGTRVYKVTGSEESELLVTIKPEDEGEVVKLWD